MVQRHVCGKRTTRVFGLTRIRLGERAPRPGTHSQKAPGPPRAFPSRIGQNRVCPLAVLARRRLIATGITAVSAAYRSSIRLCESSLSNLTRYPFPGVRLTRVNTPPFSACGYNTTIFCRTVAGETVRSITSLWHVLPATSAGWRPRWKRQGYSTRLSSRRQSFGSITLNGTAWRDSEVKHNSRPPISGPLFGSRWSLPKEPERLHLLSRDLLRHQPREQTVRHVHVNEGGQAVIADQFHNHTGGKENAESVNQSDATGPVGASAALPSPDANGNGVQIASREGKAAV